MTSIYDVPYEDIKIFLDTNNIDYLNEDDAYNQALNLLKDKKSKGHTTSIIEWIIAHNLLQNKIIIPYYTIEEIKNMYQYEINQLAKILGMKGNNRENIINILRYLHKLEEISLLPEIKDIILNNLTQLELQNIDIYELTFDNIIELLKTHRNKKELRKLISDNLSKIIVYKSLGLYLTSLFPHILNELGITTVLDDTLQYVRLNNKKIIIDIIRDFSDKILEFYTNKELNDFIDKIKNKDVDYRVHDNRIIYHIGNDKMHNLVQFTINLIRINEIGLVKQTIAVIKKLEYNTGWNYLPYIHFLLDTIDKSKLNLSTSMINNIIDSK